MILAHHRNTVNPAWFPEGAEMLRLWDGGTRWALLEPARGQYEWDKLDQHLDASEAAGLQSIYVFGSTPPWAALSVPGDPGIIDPTSNRPPDPQALSDFTDALMAHCGGRLYAIETWNEWNAPVFWIGSISDLAVLHNIIWTRVKKANPNVLVAMPSCCYAPMCEYPTVEIAMSAWLELQMPSDIATFHGYLDPETPPAGIKDTIRGLRDVLANYEIDTPLWDTEFGPGWPQAYATDDERRLWVLDALIARDQAGLDLAAYYQWDNSVDNPPSQHGTCIDVNGNLTAFGQAVVDYKSIKR